VFCLIFLTKYPKFVEIHIRMPQTDCGSGQLFEKKLNVFQGAQKKGRHDSLPLLI